MKVIRHIGHFAILESNNFVRRIDKKKPLYGLTHINTGFSMGIPWDTIREAEYIAKQIQKHLNDFLLASRDPDAIVQAFPKDFLRWIKAMRYREYKNFKPYSKDENIY